jgi:lysozyme
MGDVKSIEELLLLHEGERFRPYLDTVGVLTIGIGRNLNVGISKQESRFLFSNDLARAEAFIDRKWTWAADLDPVRRAVLVDMAFNLGGRLGQFKRTLRSLKQGKYADAAVQMLDSLWADQVGSRALRLAEMCRSGNWPSE